MDVPDDIAAFRELAMMNCVTSQSIDDPEVTMSDLVFWSVLIYIIFLHVALLFVIVKSNFLEKIAVKMGLGQPKLSFYDQMLQYHQRMDASVPDGAVIFLGDSITQALATSAVCPHSINYGIGGQTMGQLIQAMPTYQSLERAHTIVLMIGINDFWRGAPLQLIKARCQELMALIPKEARLIWCSIMPAEHPGLSISDINACNCLIKELCSTRQNCVYVDTWQFLLDSNQTLKQECYLDDALHLGDLGYRHWISALKAFV